MLANGNIIQIVTHMTDTSRNIPFDNVFHFRAYDVEGVISDPLDLGQIAADWFIGLHTVVSVYQSNVVTWDSANFENLTNSVDIGSYNPEDPLVGVVASPPEPAYVALSFQYVRATRVTRHGSKRFSGIADTLITDGSGASLAGTADMVALQNYLFEGFEAVLGAGLEASFEPVILRRTAAGVPPTVWNTLASVEYRGAGSQNSRKRLL
jgi:hypothetical protein